MKSVVKTITLLSVVLLASCGSKKTQEQEKDAKIHKIEVSTAVKKLVVQQITFTGTVEAEAVNNIAPQQPRRIEKILFEVGDHVNKDDVLVHLDKSSLVQLKAQLNNAKDEYKRIDELYKAGGVSKSDWEKMDVQYRTLQSQYDNLVENTTLTAPVSGVVTARNYDNGDMTGGIPVLVVQQICPVKIMINVSERLFSYMKTGMTVYVNVDAYGEEKFEGRVSLIYPTINGSTHTFPVEITLDNKDERVRPGMFARVTLPYAKANRVVVADRAVNKLMGSGDRYVFIVNPADSTVRYSKVELGRRLGDSFEILSGVEDSELVVVKGQTQLKDGDKTEIVNAL